MSTTKVITGKVRLCYLHVFEPQTVLGGDKKKYSASVLISKDDKVTLKKVQDAIKLAAENGKAKLGGKVPANLKTPLRDGDIDREDDPNYANCMFLNASSGLKPGVVDAELNPIMDSEDFYSGCYGRVSVNFYAFNTNGNKGIACGLNNLQKLADGERLVGGPTAEADFSDPLM